MQFSFVSIARNVSDGSSEPDLDQLFDDMKPEAAERLLNQEVDHELPGMGQHYCVPCGYVFARSFARSIHRATNPQAPLSIVHDNVDGTLSRPSTYKSTKSPSYTSAGSRCCSKSRTAAPTRRSTTARVSTALPCPLPSLLLPRAPQAPPAPPAAAVLPPIRWFHKAATPTCALVLLDVIHRVLLQHH